MKSKSQITVSPNPAGKLTFDVAVRDSGGETLHRVTVSPADAAVFAGSGVDPADIVKAAMNFLLDREPKESILRAFDIAVIRRYFPEFDEAFPAYLSRPGGGTGKRAP